MNSDLDALNYQKMSPFLRSETLRTWILRRFLSPALSGAMIASLSLPSVRGAEPFGAAPPGVFSLDAKYLQATRQRIQGGDTNFAQALAALKRDADRALRYAAVSVVDKKATPPSGDKHDYMSLAPYFWPNPNSSNGLPYIRHDGERNPEIGRISDHKNILEMPDKAQTLALEWYFSGDESYAAKAAELIRAWFLTPATRMNPNLDFAQAVPGVNTGRGTGLIESRALPKVVDAIGLLAGSKAWTEADQRGMERWFAEFLQWMRESKNGRAEAAAKNNHGTYYDLQVVSFALFLGRTDPAKEVLEGARQKRIAAQIEPDGSQPLELARTKAWSYSLGNLSGLMSLASLGENLGIDLWHFRTPDGRGIRQALDYLLPYALGRQKWPYKQLGGWSPAGFFPLLRQAAAKFPDAQYAELAARMAPVKPTDRSLLLQAPAPRVERRPR